MKFAIFQIQYTNDESDAINKLGWDLAAKVMPRVHAKLESENPQAVRKAFDANLYEHVANVEASDLEDTFRVTNMPGNFEAQIERLASMHSLSVGDVVVDESGNASLVAPFGFEAI